MTEDMAAMDMRTDRRTSRHQVMRVAGLALLGLLVLVALVEAGTGRGVLSLVAAAVVAVATIGEAVYWAMITTRRRDRTREAPPRRTTQDTASGH